MSTLNEPFTPPSLIYGDPGALEGREQTPWYRWWFTPESPTNLALCRILFFALIFQHQLTNRYSGWAGLPRSFFKPVWIFEFFHIPVLPVNVVFAMEVAWKVALFCACIGLFTRVSTWLAALLGLYLIGLQYNYGKVDHMTAMFLFAMGIMALSNCGDALSIDAWARRGRNREPVAPSGEYRWPVRMIWVLMSVIFFAAGMAKVRRGGLPWIFSENFSILLVQRHYMTSTPPLNWGLWVAKHPSLYISAAAGTIFVELCLFLALFDSYPKWMRERFTFRAFLTILLAVLLAVLRYRGLPITRPVFATLMLMAISIQLTFRIWPPRAVLPWMLLGMQLGIGLFMRVWFTPYMFVYLFWIPWGTVYERLFMRRRIAAGGPTRTAA